MPTRFRLATYNLLAPEHVSAPADRPDAYANVRQLLRWNVRMPRLVERIRDLHADVLCLQEVSRLHVSRLFGDKLERLGYALLLGDRPADRVDTVALLARTPRVRVLSRHDFSLPGESNKVAVVARLEVDRQPLFVASLHLSWTADGRSQTDQLTAFLRTIDPFDAIPFVAAGDLNLDVRRWPVWSEVASRRFSAAHPPGVPTWAAGGRAGRLDDILVRGVEVVDPLPIPPLGQRLELPNEVEPSDHVPLCADLAFRDQLSP